MSALTTPILLRCCRSGQQKLRSALNLKRKKLWLNAPCHTPGIRQRYSVVSVCINDEGAVAFSSAVRSKERKELQQLWLGRQHMVNPRRPVFRWWDSKVTVGTPVASRQKTLTGVEGVLSHVRNILIHLLKLKFLRSTCDAFRRLPVSKTL